MKKLLCLLLIILLLTGCAATYDGPTEEKPMLTEYVVRHYSPFLSGKVWEDRTVYAYDIYGNRVKAMEYDEGELASVSNLRYDDRGNEISAVHWDHTGWIPYIESRTEQTFDEQNRLTARIWYDMWGGEEGRATYTYDDEANTMRWENNLGDWVIYYYDENGLQIRDVTNGGYETLYEYDARGNRIGWISTKDGVFFDRFEAGYDEQDRQLWGRRYDESGNLVSETVFTYDDEAHSKSYNKPSDGMRIEYYTEDGRLYLIEDYDEEGNLTMYQQYTYRAIKVPATEETP